MSRYSHCVLALFSAFFLDAARAEEAVDGVTQVAVGYAHSCALVQSGDLYCWGMETVNGQATISTLATKVEGLPRVKSISAGQVSSCAVDLEDRAWCWGVDLQASIRSNEEVLSGPRLVSGLPAVVQTASGYLHNCAIARDDGAVWCWGANAVGELGDGTTEDRADPVRAGAITGATHIDAGVNNSCAIVAGGAIYCWGTDSQSDDEGVMINSTSPQHFDESRNATRVANGRNFVCSRQDNAQVICFGSNIMNQLGDSAAGMTYTIAQPKGLGPARDVDAGGFFACALVDTGDVFCWGLLPSSEEISLDGADPQAVSGLVGVKALAVGFESACALQSDNRLLCWGNNETGQLGNGLTGGYSIAPVEVVGLPGGDAALLHAARARMLQDIGKAQAALAEADMAIGLRPDRAALLLLRADILRDLGQIDRAIDDLEKALRAEPENAEALHEYGALLFGQGRTDAAIAVFERAIAANQNDALSYVELGRIMLSVGEREQADKNFSTAKSIKPDIAQVYDRRGFEATLNESYVAAIANYDIAILLDPEDGSLYGDRADAYEAMGDKDKAEADRKWKASLEHASAEFDRLTEEGWSLYEADEFAKAIDLYTQALAIRPLDDFALWQRSLAYDDMENYERAIADLDKAISINPEDADYYQYRANSYAALGQVDKALADYDMSLSLERDAYTYELRASANAMAGRVDDAIADYTSALELDPRSVLSIYPRGLLLLDQKDDPQAALGDFSLLVSIDPNDKTYQLNLARAYQGIGNTDAAFAAISKALELDPEYAWAYRIRGDLYSDQGHVTEAIADYSKAIEINPDYDLAFKLRGELYWKLERNEAAVADFTRAIEIDPEYGEAILSRAYALMSLGQDESAVDELTRALELYPDYSWAIFARGRAYRHLQKPDLAVIDLARASAAGEIYASLFLYLTEWQTNEALALAHLSEAASAWGSQDWPRPIMDYFLGVSSREALSAGATNAGEQCEVEFYVASALLLRQETEAAIDLFHKAVETCPHDFIEYDEARGMLAGLGK